MNVKFVFISIIIVGVGTIGLLILNDQKPMGLVGPTLSQVKIETSPSPSPSVLPKFQFNSQTDLKAELEKVNPQVSDEDFE